MLQNISQVIKEIYTLHKYWKSFKKYIKNHRWLHNIKLITQLIKFYFIKLVIGNLILQGIILSINKNMLISTEYENKNSKQIINFYIVTL